MRPPGSPRTGVLAGSNTQEPRGSAPRERDHRGGDHPVPSRTRQLSPPSPIVLQRKAAGGQGVALAEGAFLFARGAGVEPAARRARVERGPRGDRPLRASPRFGGFCNQVAARRAPSRHPAASGGLRPGGRSSWCSAHGMCRRARRDHLCALSALCGRFSVVRCEIVSGFGAGLEYGLDVVPAVTELCMNHEGQVDYTSFQGLE